MKKLQCKGLEWNYKDGLSKQSCPSSEHQTHYPIL